MTRSNKILFTLAASIIVAALVSALFLLQKQSTHKVEKQSNNFREIPVEVIETTSSPFYDYITAIGYIKPNNTIPIRSPVPGQVVSVLFDSGSLVKKDDLLLRFDNTLAALQLKQKKAEYLRAKAEYSIAAKLYNKKAMSLSQKDKILFKMQSLEQQCKINEFLLNQLYIQAPQDGLIHEKKISVGEYTIQDQVLAELHAIDDVKVVFQVSEQHLEKIHLNQPIEVECDVMPEYVFFSKIKHISSAINNKTHGIHMYGILSNKDYALKPGMFARIKIKTTYYPQATVIPTYTVFLEEGNEYVYTVTDDNIVKKIFVKTGKSDGSNIWVLKGLAPHTKVISSGKWKITEGERVKVVSNS